MVSAPGLIDAPARAGDDHRVDGADDGGSDRSTARRAWYDGLEHWIGVAIVAACSIFVFFQLHPSLVLSNTTITGGDTGAHVWFPAYLRDHLLPWRLSGWAPDFYAGFP